MTARYLVGDVFDRLAELETGSVDLVITSPPFLALRSYLPADHPDKAKEMGSEATPAEWLDTQLEVMAELRRVTAGHGSVCIEVGDTYSMSGGAGGDYGPGGLRDGQPTFKAKRAGGNAWGGKDGPGWPLAKSKALIPELFRVALAYGINPLTGQTSPAGKWLVRNVVTWCRPNPPVGALGDKWRPATSDVVVACTSPKRYWDDLATRRPFSESTLGVLKYPAARSTAREGLLDNSEVPNSMPYGVNGAGAPLLDYWEIPPTGYAGAHYAVYPPALVEPLVKAMCPQKVCRTCGEPARRIVSDAQYLKPDGRPARVAGYEANESGAMRQNVMGFDNGNYRAVRETLGWTDCGHDGWRPGLILDPFAGSGTTLQVATGHGLEAIGIDLDERNAVLAEQRIGGLFLEVER